MWDNIKDIEVFIFCFGQLREAIWKISPYTKKYMLYQK